MYQVGIITNPHSKMNKRNPRHSQLLSHILGNKGELHRTDTLEALAEVMTHFADKGVDLIAVHGGDGTISQTLSAAIRSYADRPLPKIALLGGGTMNVTAKNLGSLDSSESRLGRLVQRCSYQEALTFTQRLSISVEGQFGFLYADGTACNFLNAYYEEKTSALGAFWFLIKLCASAFAKGQLFEKVVKSQPLFYTNEHKSYARTDSTIFFASTLRTMPLGFPFFGLMPGNLRSFQCIDITCPPEQFLKRLIPLFFSTVKMESPYKRSFSCEHLEIDRPAGYNYSLDGELFTSQRDKLRIEKGPIIDFVQI